MESQFQWLFILLIIMYLVTMIDNINSSWNWKGFNAIEILLTNEFGNVIFKTDQNEYWRLCPEDSKCEKIATTKSKLNNLLSDPDFIEDWEMTNLILLAKNVLGELEEGQKYCLKMPNIRCGLLY